MYGFYRGSIRLMKFFFNVTDKQIFEIGFLVGLLTAVVVIVSGVLTHRHLNLHIDEARPHNQPTTLPHRPPARTTSPALPPLASPLAPAGVYIIRTQPLSAPPIRALLISLLSSTIVATSLFLPTLAGL